VLISIGQDNRDGRLVDCALEAFERMKGKAPNEPSLSYYIVNGYQTIYELNALEGGASPLT
jgi:hypothetical protein